jgi:ABC-2 type transport system ATP-binding protein
MAQRLLLARALMHSPDVLFLDEPTNSLDPQSRLFLWERIRALNARGVTALLTTHDMHEADQLCERIAIMDKGRILVIDTAEELKKRFTDGSWLELRIWLPRGISSSMVLTTLTQLPDVTKVKEIVATTEEEKQSDVCLFHLYAANVGTLVADVVLAIAGIGAELRHFHLSHPTLEDVFITLTGRNLRS